MGFAITWCAVRDGDVQRKSTSWRARRNSGASANAEAQRAAGGDAAGVDYIFEIPLRIAQALVVFKHDEVTPEPFVMLSRPAPKKGLIGRLFGG